jgi:hypothetical protein
MLAVVVDWAPAEATQANHPPSTSTSPPVDMTVCGDSPMVAGDITCSPTGGWPRACGSPLHGGGL